MTALWEQALNQIAERTLTLDLFMRKQTEFIQHLMKVCLQQGMKMGKIEVKKCPKCGTAMQKRVSKNGNAFWGCIKYPNCDGIEFINTKKKMPPRKNKSFTTQIRGKIL